MVDTLVLEANAAKRASSSLAWGTTLLLKVYMTAQKTLLENLAKDLVLLEQQGADLETLQKVTEVYEQIYKLICHLDDPDDNNWKFNRQA